MYGATNIEFNLIDLNRTESAVVWMERGEITRWNIHHLFRRSFPITGYTNNGYKVKFLYKDNLYNRVVISHKKLSDRKIQNLRNKYEEYMEQRNPKNYTESDAMFGYFEFND